MWSWLKWIIYFFIFTFLIIGLRGCVNDQKLGDVTYGFPFVYMDSRSPSYAESPTSSLTFHKPEIKNFYGNNLKFDIAFWVLVFASFYFYRNVEIFTKYKNEIKYGLFFVALFIVSSIFSIAFDNQIFIIISYLGIFVLIYTGSAFGSIVNIEDPTTYSTIHQKLLTFYPYVDDLPSRVGFIFAALLYFIIGVIVYKLKPLIFWKKKIKSK